MIRNRYLHIHLSVNYLTSIINFLRIFYQKNLATNKKVSNFALANGSQRPRSKEILTGMVR